MEKNTMTNEEHFVLLFDAYGNFDPLKIAMINQVKNYTKCYKLMYGIPVGINAKKILELGIGSEALSTYIFLEALKVTGGHLTSVELNVEFNYAKFCKYDKEKWTLIHCDSASVEINDIFDLIMIDTSHEAEQTKKELIKYIPLLRKDGYLYMHDTNEMGVKKPLDEYLTNNPGILEIFYKEENTPQMTILKKL